MINWPELEKKYLMHTVERVPVTLVRGQGARVWDDAGREYLDFVGGWAVDALGHCHPVLEKALSEQARTLIQVSNQFYSVPQLKLAELLVKNSCLDKVFFCNSGAEANEGAVKLARRFGQQRKNGAYEVITMLGSFHGRTLAMVAATGQPRFQTPYAPLPPGFVNVPYNSLEAVKAATTAKTCAVMVEPVQGESGVYIPGEKYLEQVREWCDKNGLLLILDEVQTGIGRLGRLFGHEVYGVEPDIMTLAKGLGGGVPIGAIMAKDGCSVFVPGEHGSTFGGNPLACAAAAAVVEYILNNDVLGNVTKVGGYFLERLNGLKDGCRDITEVRGRGLLAAMEFRGDFGQQMLMTCLGKGLLVNRVKPNALRLMPPLNIGIAEADEAISILGEALAELRS
ncbi:MAG: aspartate aminotransferase family protein [Chloroflexi bacterium]|nr:aspartate aminotransferase family protein [Chloroflexota bacterium]